MDFHSLKRKQLQSLCKKHGIPANKTNLQMADLLTATLKAKGNSIPEEESDEKFSVDEGKKYKKVRFSPDIETREYEPSAYRKRLRSSRKTVDDHKGEVVGRTVKESSKGIARTASRRKSLAQLKRPAASDGPVMLKESRKQLRNLDLDVANRVKASSQTIKDVTKASQPASSPRRSRRKTSLLNPTLVSDEAATGEAFGKFEQLNEKITGKEIYVANQLRRSTRNASRYSGIAMSVEMKKIAESVGEVKGKCETVLKSETTVSATVNESLIAKPSRRSAGHASKRDLVSGKKKQKSTSGVPTKTEETVFSNILPPSVDTGLKVPGAAGEKRCSRLNSFNGLKNSKKRGRGKRSIGPSALNSDIRVGIDSPTNLVKTVASDSTEEALRVAGESAVVNENLVLVDDTGNLISYSSIEGGTDDECRSLETCANLDNNNSAEFDLEEFQAKAGESSNVTGLEKVQGKSTSKDACHGSDDISCHSTEVDRINYQKGGVCIVERFEHDDMKDGIEYRLVTENGRSVSSVVEEIATGTNKDLFQETHDVNDHSTEVGRSIEEDGVGLERNEQNDTVDKKEHGLVAHNWKGSLVVGAETFMEFTEDIHHECNYATKHSNEVQRNYVEQDRVSGLQRTEHNDSTDKLQDEVESHNQNDNFLGGSKIFLHVGKGTIHGTEDNEIVASGGHACDASEFSGRNCKYEREEGKGICQFAPEENVANRGEYELEEGRCQFAPEEKVATRASATELFLSAGNHFVKSRKKYQDEKAIRTNLDSGEKDVSEGIQADALPQLYIEELEDGKAGNTATPMNSNDKLLHKQDLGDCVVFEREVSDYNAGKPFEASYGPTFLELPSYKFNNYENTVAERNCIFDAVADEPVTQHNNLGVDMVDDQSMEGPDVEQNEVEVKESECSMKVELVNCQEVAAKVNTSADSSFSRIICKESLDSHIATKELVSGKVVEVQLNAEQCEEVVRAGIKECALVVELTDHVDIEEVATQVDDSGKESSLSGRKNAELMPQSSGNIAMVEKTEEKELEFELAPSKKMVESALFTNKEVNSIHGNGEHVQVVDEDPSDNSLIIRDSGQVMHLEQDHLEISEREALDDKLTSEDSGRAMLRKDNVASFEKHEQEEEIQFGKVPLSVTDEPTYTDDLGDMSAINREDEQVVYSFCAACEGVAVKSSSFNGEENDALDNCISNYGLDNLKEAENISYCGDQCIGENEVCEEDKDVGTTTAGKSNILEGAADEESVLLVFSVEPSHEMAGTNLQKTKSSYSKWGASTAEISLHADSYCGKTEIDLGDSFTHQNEKTSCEKFERQMMEDEKVENGRVQRSGEDVNDPADSASLGNDDRRYHESANEKLYVHQDTMNGGVFLDDNDFLDKLSCENKSKIQAIEIGKEHCLHMIDDKIVSVVADSKQTADTKNLDASTPCKGKLVIDRGENETSEAGKEHCLPELDDEVVTADSKQTMDTKNLDAISPSKGNLVIDERGDFPYHESETLELNLFLEEGEHGVEKPVLEASQINSINKDAGEFITDLSSTQVADDQHGEYEHQMDEDPHSKLTNHAVSSEPSNEQSEELKMQDNVPANADVVEGEHGVEKSVLEASQINSINKDAGEFITDLSSTQVADDQHGEYEHQMDEDAHSKLTNHAVSSEPSNEQSEELKMQDNVPANADVVEGEHGVEKPVLEASQINSINKDAGEFIIDLSSTQVADDQHGEYEHQMDEDAHSKLTNHAVSSEPSNEQSEELKMQDNVPANADVVEGEHGVEKPVLEASQINSINKDAGEFITDLSSTQVADDQHGEYEHQMDEDAHSKLTNHAVSSEPSNEQSKELKMQDNVPANADVVEGEHGVEKPVLEAYQINSINKDAGEFITDLSSTQVADDQHGEYEHQMDEDAHSKLTNHAVSSEPSNEQSEELKMQDNVPANADVVLQGSIVCENEETESFKIEHFHVNPQKVLMENAAANSFPDAAPFEQTLKCEPSILRRGNSAKSIVEERRKAMEPIEDMTENSGRIADQSLAFVSTGISQAGDGQSCQLKSLSAKVTSSRRENDKHDLYRESLTLSVMKRTRNRNGLILRTPQKVPDLHVMKENAPSMKREQLGSMIAPIASLKRRPLEDLRKK